MFVSVKFFQPLANGYAGMAYTYETQLPLKPDDVVLAPTKKEPNARAIVVETDLPSPGFACKEIKRYYFPEADMM